MLLNIFGEPLVHCCQDPVTGFYRDGYCRTSKVDGGKHVICAVMTKSFLTYTLKRGNDLITPRPAFSFPGLKPGDRWCLCALRWKEAYDAGVAPPVVLEACAEESLAYIPMEILVDKAFKY